MGNGYSSDGECVEVRTVQRVQIRTVLAVRDGELIFGNTNLEGQRVPVFADKCIVRVGCHTLSRGAWELLKKLVDGRKAAPGERA
jgi:hypothetical protein